MWITFFLDNQVRLAQKGSQQTVRRRIPLKPRFYCLTRKYTIFFFRSQLEQARYDWLQNKFSFNLPRSCPPLSLYCTAYRVGHVTQFVISVLIYVCKQNASGRLTQTSTNVLHHLQFLPVIWQFSLYYKEHSLTHHESDRLQWSVV